MVEDALARGLLTAVFALTAAWFAGHGVRGGSWADRVCDTFHVLMSLSMVAMAWPWGTAVPVLPQVLLFAAASVWFVLMAVLPPDRPPRNREHTDRGAWLPWLHVVMMVSMVWMLLAMPALHGATTAAGPLTVLSGVAVLVLLVSGTVLSVTATVPVVTGGRSGPRLPWHAAHVAMGAGMVAMVAPLLVA